MTTGPTPWWKTLYNHNPFYALSTVMMLISVRAAYGEMPIGDINCWLVMGVLAGYTMLLALIGVCIIRFGKIWEDARSILLLLLLLFLGISVSMDDLFVKMGTPQEGAILAAGGVLFSFVVTETVLLLSGIQLKIRYRLPYYLFMFLFYFTPWWFSPELHPRQSSSMEWLLLLFPVVTAAIILTLLPAVWAGPQYIKNNGTPWKWPMYPWSMFVILVVATLIRSYALCLTFAPTGPIWRELSGGSLGIVFSTTWGTWFLVPVLWAILILLLEGGLVVRSRKQCRLVMWLAPIMLLFSLPLGSSQVFTSFWDRTVQTIGSPVWLTVCLIVTFYAWAYLRKVPGAATGILFSLLLFSRIGPATDSIATLLPLQPWPFALLGAVLMIRGLREWSSSRQAFAMLLLIFSVWLYLPSTAFASWKATLSFAAIWGSAIIIGLIHKDKLAGFLRAVAGVQAILVGLYILFVAESPEFLFIYKMSAILILAVCCLIIAYLCRSYWYLLGCFGNIFIFAYGTMMIGYHQASQYYGTTAIASFCWSVGMLIFALLISAHKAHWLPASLVPRSWSR